MDTRYYTEQVYGTGFICDASGHHFKIIKTENFLRLAHISYVFGDYIVIRLTPSCNPRLPLIKKLAPTTIRGSGDLLGKEP